jgi:hypothetical protein
MLNSSSASGQDSAFPTTQWTVILDVVSMDPEKAQKALAKLCELYRQPIVNWFRRNEFRRDPEDRAHDFVAYLIEKKLVERTAGQAVNAKPEAGRFRRFLATAMWNFLRDCWDKDGARKRGADATSVPLGDWDGSAQVQAVADSQLDLEIALTIHARVMQKLVPAPELAVFIFQKDSCEPWDEISIRLQRTPEAVRKEVSRLRRRHWELFRDEVAQIVTPPNKAEETRYLYELLFRNPPLEP